MSDAKVYVLGAHDLAFSVSPTRGVSMSFDPGLIPSAKFTLELSPAEARLIAEMLSRKATEAEALSPPN